MAEANVVLVTIVADVKNCDGDTGRDTPRPNRYAEIQVANGITPRKIVPEMQPRYALATAQSR